MVPANDHDGDAGLRRCSGDSLSGISILTVRFNSLYSLNSLPRQGFNPIVVRGVRLRAGFNKQPENFEMCSV
jgi:hypothetical protein